MIELNVSKAEDGRKVKNFLMKHFPLAPASLLYKTLREKDVKVNGVRIKGEETLKAGDQVVVYFSDEKAASLGYKPVPISSISGFSSRGEKTGKNGAVSDSRTEKRFEKGNASLSKEEKRSNKKLPAIPVVYQDEQVLILNKPVGVLSQKDTPQSYSLTEYLKDHYSDESGFAPAIVNRLDRNTSGVILAGRTVRSLQQLNEMIRYHRGEKMYLAVVHGCWKKGREAYAVHRWDKDTASNTARVERVYLGETLDKEYAYLKNQEGSSENGAKAEETLVLCHVEGIAENSDKNMSLVRLMLYTGKSHQLRSQLFELGFPIAGDPKYQKKTSSVEFPLRRQLLHAWRYQIAQLTDGLEYLNGQKFTAAPDREMTQIMNILFPDWEKQI